MGLLYGLAFGLALLTGFLLGWIPPLGSLVPELESNPEETP